MKKKEIIKYIFEKANPIVRYRIANELVEDKTEYDIGTLRADLLKQKDAKYWMKCLKTRRKYDNIHGSYDKCPENSLGKLSQFGIQKGISNFDKNVSKHLKWLENIKDEETDLPHNTYFLQTIIASLLAKVGYAKEPVVRDFLLKRLKLVYDFTKQKDYSIFIEKSLFKSIPKAFSEHKMLDPQLYLNDDFSLPWIYDLFAYNALYEDFKEEIDTVIKYILDERYQKLPKDYGVIISAPKRFKVVGWNIWLPGYFNFDSDNFIKQNLLFRLNLMSKFEPTKKSEWYKNNIKHLEEFKTKNETYIFPKQYVKEKRNTYFINASHMGLGEKRSSDDAIEIESTFWMLQILNN